LESNLYFNIFISCSSSSDSIQTAGDLDMHMGMSPKLSGALLWTLDSMEWCLDQHWVTGSLISNFPRHTSSFRSYLVTKIGIFYCVTDLTKTPSGGLLYIMDNMGWCADHSWVSGSLILNIPGHTDTFRFYPVNRIDV